MRAWIMARVMYCVGNAPVRLLDVMKKEMETAQAAVLPASALGKAVSYTLSLWEKLTRFLEHPELELSNNLAENSMRPVVLGRKNWIHVGSEQAGPKVAAILSVVETCRRLKMPVREYLAWVLPGLGNMPVQRVQSVHACCLGCFPQFEMKTDPIWTGSLLNRSCSPRRPMTPGSTSSICASAAARSIATSSFPRSSIGNSLMPNPGAAIF